MEAEREAELHSNWPAYVQRLESDRDAGWAAADALAGAIGLVIEQHDELQRDDPLVYAGLQACREALAAYAAARAKRTT